MKTENARTDRAKPIWPSDYSQAGHKKNVSVSNPDVLLKTKTCINTRDRRRPVCLSDEMQQV